MTSAERAVALKRLGSKIQNCVKCPRLVASRTHPAKGFGTMRLPVVLVGLNPSKRGQNESGIPFRMSDGRLIPSGRALLHDLAGLGVRFEDLYFTELTKCHASDNRPRTDEIENCLPYLKLLQPDRVVTLGRVVARAIVTIDLESAQLVRLKHPSYVQRFLAKRPGYFRHAFQRLLRELAEDPRDRSGGKVKRDRN